MKQSFKFQVSRLGFRVKLCSTCRIEYLQAFELETRNSKLETKR